MNQIHHPFDRSASNRVAKCPRMLTLFTLASAPRRALSFAHTLTPLDPSQLSPPCTPSSCSLQSLSAIPHHPPRSMLVKRLDARALAFLPSRFFLNRVVLSLLSNFHHRKGKQFSRKIFQTYPPSLFSFLLFFPSFLFFFFLSLFLSLYLSSSPAKNTGLSKRQTI